MQDVCVIVPVYNEALTVAMTVSDLLQTFDHVVCVDDGSGDGSADLARAAGATVLRHVLNQGQGAALRTGFDYVLRHTTASYAVTFDADGQHLVEDARRMVERARAEQILRWLEQPGVRLVHVDGEWTCPVRGAARHLATHDAVEQSRVSLVPFDERRQLSTVHQP